MQRTRGPARTATNKCQVARPQGFTLIELMVTIAVAAILLAIATPSFTSIINSNRLTGAANEMVATLQAARMEAVRLNTTVNVQIDADAGSMVAFVDGQENDPIRVATISPAVELSGGTDLVFLSSGFGYDAADPNGVLLATSFRFCIPTTRPAENVRVVSIGSGSRISTESEDGEGACPSP